MIKQTLADQSGQYVSGRYLRHAHSNINGLRPHSSGTYKLTHKFTRWLARHPSDIGTRVRCGRLYELMISGPDPSLLRTLARDVAELERVRGENQ